MLHHLSMNVAAAWGRADGVAAPRPGSPTTPGSGPVNLAGSDPAATPGSLAPLGAQHDARHAHLDDAAAARILGEKNGGKAAGPAFRWHSAAPPPPPA